MKIILLNIKEVEKIFLKRFFHYIIDSDEKIIKEEKKA